jgi:hypothetical protein
VLLMGSVPPPVPCSVAQVDVTGKPVARIRAVPFGMVRRSEVRCDA